jgi:hypothetical protein
MEHESGLKKYQTNYGLVHPRLSYLHLASYGPDGFVFKNISNAVHRYN